MSRRSEQVAQTLRRAIEGVLGRGLNDPRIRGMVSVTGVTVSEDLRQATVRVSVYPDEHEQLTLHGLQSASGHIRREAGELVALSRMPELRFKLDRSLKRQAGVLDALAQAQREREGLEGGDAEGNDGGDGPRAGDAGAAGKEES